MIEGMTGLPGAGKTYLATKRALKQIKKGIRVYANYPLEGAIPYKQIEELFEIRRLPGEKYSPHVYIDEAGLIAPAGSWKAIPFEVMAHWRQHRHSGINITWMAQDPRDVAVPLRRVTQLITNISKFGPIIKWRTYNPTTKGKYGSGFTIFDISLAKKYDSYAANVERQNYLKGV